MFGDFWDSVVFVAVGMVVCQSKTVHHHLPCTQYSNYGM